MIERVVTFGNAKQLVGIYAVADETAGGAATDASSRPAVLFLSAGLLHKVGPNRLHVDLARRLAERGYASMRFDISGIGDSPPRTDGASEEERAVQDTIAAMDALQKKFGHRKFLLFGLCSGADVAHPTALRDRRVAGIVGLDAYIYPTVRSYLHSHVYRYLGFFTSPTRMFQYLQRKLGSVRRGGADAGRNGGDADETFVRPFPPRNEIVGELQQLVDRGVRLLFVYSGGYSLYRYDGQFYDCFKAVRFGDRLSCRYVENADHIYTLSRDREVLMETVVDWVERGAE